LLASLAVIIRRLSGLDATHMTPPWCAAAANAITA
jgi:hypothetical protein